MRCIGEFVGLVFLLGAGGSLNSKSTIRFFWSFVVQCGFQIFLLVFNKEWRNGSL